MAHRKEIERHDGALDDGGRRHGRIDEAVERLRQAVASAGRNQTKRFLEYVAEQKIRRREKREKSNKERTKESTNRD